jgi:predicted dehydrogenase
LAQIHAAQCKIVADGAFDAVIRLGIIGTNYGRAVQLPAFRADPRCEVIALAGSDATRAAEFAKAIAVPKAYGDWRALVDDKDVQAIAIATLPSLQAQIAIRALALGKPVFAEKPMATDLAAARAMLNEATRSRKPTIIDFNFHQIMSWQRAKTMLDSGVIGALRHVAVHWHVESRAIQLRMRSWKTRGDDGGGVIGNFISHCFHYLEWFCGPITGLSARVCGLPDDNELETTVAMALQLASGPLVSLSMSCASFLGGGHKIEFFGEDGTLALHNPAADYMRGFELTFAKRPAAVIEHIPVQDPIDSKYPDGRIAPVSRLAKMFFDAIETGGVATPGFSEGYRVQQLIDAARQSHRQGAWINVAPETMKEEMRA